MVEIRTVRESDLADFRRLHNTYVDRDESLDTIRNLYQDHPELLLGAYDDGTLVGHCLGWPQSADEVELSGIAVVESHRRRGLGSALLGTFEDRATALGFRRISLGSAGGYVDRFYLANGYSPQSVLVRLPADEPLSEQRDAGYEISDVQIEDGTRKLSIAVDEVDPTFLEDVRDAFDDSDAIYIMKKELGTA